MARPVAYEFPLSVSGGSPSQDDVIVELTNGQLQGGLFKMALFDSGDHLISEPLPSYDRDVGRSHIIRALGFPGMQLQGCVLKVYGLVIAPRPGAGQPFAISLRTSQNVNHVKKMSNGTFDEAEAVRFKVSFV